MNVEIGAEAALFPEKEYISGIFVTVCVQLSCGRMTNIEYNQNKLMRERLQSCRVWRKTFALDSSVCILWRPLYRI
jgi:hypothetical protein